MKVGIVGSGTMGKGIAQVAAQAGHETIVYDNRTEALEKAQQSLDATMKKLVDRGKFTADEAAQCLERIIFVDALDKLSPVGLVVEAVIEDLNVKQQLFSRLESIVSNSCVLASNTSSFSIASIAGACESPQRVIGLHFFNPAPVMKLVEVVPAVQSSDSLAGQMVNLMNDWGKTPVIAKDTPAFIVNRIARPFYGEALRIFDEGIADGATIDWAMKEIAGFRMGPFELMDFIGHDVNYRVTESVFEAFYYDSRYKPSFTQKRWMEAGYLGRKSGRGYYDYSENAQNPEPNRDEELGNKIVERIVAMLMNEAIDALFWGIATAEDIELAMTKGVNYPKGLLQWANEWGPEHLLRIIDGLYKRYREDRYRASPQLRDVVKGERRFW